MLSFEELKKNAQQRQANADKTKQKDWETIKSNARAMATIDVDEKYISTFLSDAQNYLNGANGSCQNCP